MAGFLRCALCAVSSLTLLSPLAAHAADAAVEQNQPVQAQAVDDFSDVVAADAHTDAKAEVADACRSDIIKPVLLNRVDGPEADAFAQASLVYGVGAGTAATSGVDAPNSAKPRVQFADATEDAQACVFGIEKATEFRTIRGVIAHQHRV